MSSSPRSLTGLEILQTGPQCLVEDLGRPGRAGEGVTISGAVDRRSYLQGNRLVGNEIGAPAIEVLLGGLTVRPARDAVVAVTGAWCPVTIDDSPVSFGTPLLVRAGSVLRLGHPEHGLRSYLAVRGGVIPTGEFGGSWSTDTSSGIGPAPVRAGDNLPVGNRVARQPLIGEVPPAVPAGDELTLRLTLGPRPKLLGAEAHEALTRRFGDISAHSDRIGIRLNGFDLAAPPGDGASQALPLGAVQAPRGGELIVFHVDHPTTGGYPVIGVVHGEDLDLLAQCGPGRRVRFAVRPAPSY